MSAENLMSDAIKAAAIEELRSVIENPKCAEVWSLVAKKKRIVYDAFIAAGFTPEQSLQLTIAMPL